MQFGLKLIETALAGALTVGGLSVERDTVSLHHARIVTKHNLSLAPTLILSRNIRT